MQGEISLIYMTVFYLPVIASYLCYQLGFEIQPFKRSVFLHIQKPILIRKGQILKDFDSTAWSFSKQPFHSVNLCLV